MGLRAGRRRAASGLPLLLPVLVVAALLVAAPPAKAAPPAAAASLAGDLLTVDGPPVTIQLAAGQTTTRTFGWDTSARVRLVFSNCFNIDFDVPLMGERCTARPPGTPNSGIWLPYTPRDAGPNRIDFAAVGDAPGQVTIALQGVAPQVSRLIEPNGAAQSVTLAIPREAAWFEFNASVDDELTLDVSTPNDLGDGCWGSVNVRLPDDTQLFPLSWCFRTGGRKSLGRLPQAGTYRIELQTGLSGVEFATLTFLLLTTRTPLPETCKQAGVRPIMLVHGFNGSADDFAHLRPFLIARVREELLAAGVPTADAETCAGPFVEAVELPGRASTESNGERLRPLIGQLFTRTGNDVDIIAHSKGGLDSRYALGEGLILVRNLMMIATPNGGTPLADVACGAYNLDWPEQPFVQQLIERHYGKCRGSQDALFALTQDSVRDGLNPTTPDNERVVYSTIAGASSCNWCRTVAALVGMGDNDGMVPVSSVQFLRNRGQFDAGVFDATHSGLLSAAEVWRRAYCSLVDRHPSYPPCGGSPGAAAAGTAAQPVNPATVSHLDALEVPASGSATVTLPLAGLGTSDIALLTDGPGLTVTGAAFSREPAPYLGETLTARITSAGNATLTVTNPTIVSVRLLVLVRGSTGPAALDVRVTPTVARPNQPVEVRVVGSSAAGISGTVTRQTGARTGLTFTASGTDAVATFIPAAADTYGITVAHQAGTRRVAFRRLVVGTGAATLPGTYVESVSRAADNRISALNLDVNVTVTQAGTYALAGGLSTPTGMVVATRRATAALAAGTTRIRLRYSGAVLYAAGVNGPYRLADLTLTRAGAIEAQVPMTGPTAAYDFHSFTPAVVIPGSVTVTEGNSGTRVAQVPLTLSEPVGTPVTVEFVSVEPAGAATFPEDYDPVWSSVTFRPGQTTVTIPVTIKGDTLDEDDEPAWINVYAASHAEIGGFGGQGGVVIRDDDPLPAVVPGAVSVTEGDTGTKVVQVPVTLSAPSGRTVTVSYASLNQPGGYATWPEDYEPVLGTLTFLPGETSKTVALTIKGDTLDENDEGAILAFGTPTNATLGGLGVGGVTIIDDE